MTEKEKKKQQRKAYIDKIAAMSGRDKWQFFKDYCLKGTLCLIAALLILAGLCRDVWLGKRDCAFYALVINNHSSIPDTFRNDFISYSGLDERKYNIIIDSTMQMDLSRMDTMTVNNMQQIIALSSARMQDIFLADAQVIEYYWDAGYIVDIRDVLSENFLRPHEDRFYYLTDPDGNAVPVGIDVSGSPILEQNNMYVNQKPTVSVVYQAANPESIEKFISFLYETEISG